MISPQAIKKKGKALNTELMKTATGVNLLWEIITWRLHCVDKMINRFVLPVQDWL